MSRYDFRTKDRGWPSSDPADYDDAILNPPSQRETIRDVVLTFAGCLGAAVVLNLLAVVLWVHH